MDRLYGNAISALETAMRFRLERQGALASNVANADTPGYRRVDLTFDQALGDAQRGLAGTHPRHWTSGGETPGTRLVLGPRGTRLEGTGVDRDQEVLTMSRNAGAFQDAAAVLSRIYALRRMAATGELG